MSIFTGIAEIRDFTESRTMCLALGSFDGVHLGHQALLRRTLELASARGLTPGVLLHEPHPAKVTAGGEGFKLLTALDEKVRWIRLLGDINVFVLPFDAGFAGHSPEEFARRYLAGLCRVKTAVVGFNYRFGRGRAGNARTLAGLGGALGFDCEVAPKVESRGEALSSTSIRRAIGRGEMYEAYAGLGHCHVFAGVVVRGRRVGTGLGFPTANIRLGEDSVWPAYGVYGGFAMDAWGGAHKCVVNAGLRPTVDGAGARASFEVHLMDFTGDLYGSELKVVLGRMIRPEARFDGLSELKAQIARDTETARASLGAWEAALRQKDLGPLSLFTCFIGDFPL